IVNPRSENRDQKMERGTGLVVALHHPVEVCYGCYRATARMGVRDVRPQSVEACERARLGWCCAWESCRVIPARYGTRPVIEASSVPIAEIRRRLRIGPRPIVTEDHNPD